MQDEVEVKEPYVPEACLVRATDNKSKKPASSAQNGILSRVQLIIKAERKRLGLMVQ